MEGVKNVGLRAAFDWKLSKTALAITVGINFVKKTKTVDGRISQWLADIKEIWSTFKAVNVTDPKAKSMNLDFAAKRGGKDHTVDVFRFDPTLQEGRSKEQPVELRHLVHHRHRPLHGAARVRPPDRARGRVQPDRGALRQGDR